MPLACYALVGQPVPDDAGAIYVSQETALVSW